MGFFSSSSQQQNSNTGLDLFDKSSLSGWALPQIMAGVQRGKSYAETPFTLPTMAFPTLSPRGLFAEQESALASPFAEAVRQALGQASSNAATRGFLNTENIQAIAGSAAQNVAPRFAELFANTAGQNVGAKTAFEQSQLQGLPMQLEQIRQARLQQYLTGLGQIPGFLGSSGSSSSSGPGFGQGLTTSIIGAMGSAASGSRSTTNNYMGSGSDN